MKKEIFFVLSPEIISEYISFICNMWPFQFLQQKCLDYLNSLNRKPLVKKTTITINNINILYVGGVKFYIFLL